MTRDETIELMKNIKAVKPKYFDSLPKEKKLELVEQWATRFDTIDYVIIHQAVMNYIFNHNRVPYPQEINAAIKEDENPQKKMNPWYKRFPQPGVIHYTDADVRGLTFEDWKALPREMAKRMEYYPDKNDEYRNKLLQEALELQRSIYE